MCIFCTPDDAPLSSGKRTDEELLAIERCPNLAHRVPVSIVTGFLGAGKTTLVNWLLQGSHGRKFCVLQNEFGAIPIDDALIVRSQRFAEVAVVTMPTGCVCCKVRGDLVEGLQAPARGVLDGAGHFDAVIVETSGLSEVGPVAQTFFADRFVQRNFRLDAVLAVVNAQTAPAALRLVRSIDDDEEEEEEEDFGDETDAQSDDEHTSTASQSTADADDRRLRMRAGRLLCEQLCLADVVLLNKLDLISEDEAAEAESLVRSVNSAARIVPCHHSQANVEQLLDLNAFSLERAQSVSELFHADSYDAKAEAQAVPGSAAFAFARPRVATLRPGAASSGVATGNTRVAAEDPTHLHAHFGSVGVESASELDELAFSDWMEDVLRKYGARLYRAKGVLFYDGVDEPTAVQCVGAHMESERMSCGEAADVAEERRSRLVFIGRTRGIEDELRDGFRACAL